MAEITQQYLKDTFIYLDDGASKKWIVQVTNSDGVRQHIGLFEKEFDTIMAAQLARESEHKEFCNHGG